MAFLNYPSEVEIASLRATLNLLISDISTVLLVIL